MSCEYVDVKEISRRDFEEKSPERDFHNIIGGFQYLNDFHGAVRHVWLGATVVSESRTRRWRILGLRAVEV